MSNSMSDDYFSFMSGKGERKAATPARSAAPAVKPKPQAVPDVIEFEDDSQMTVTETSITDTMIQRIFRIPGAS